MRPSPTPRPAAALPDEVAAVLRRARDREDLAVGGDRVSAFRLTRALLGGARAAGYTVRQLADCLAVTPSSMRARSYSDDWIDEAVFAELAGLDGAEIEDWRWQGRLTAAPPMYGDEKRALAGDLIAALTGRPRPKDR